MNFRQADSLLERLVVRMGTTTGQQQRRYLAFCISLLPITDKGVKKMTELIRHIKESLTDDMICDYFKTCITKVKKSFQKGVADEVNAVLQDFETAMADIRGESELMGVTPSVETNESAEQATLPKSMGGKATKRDRANGKTQKKKPSKRKAMDSSDEEVSEDDPSEEAEMSFSSSSCKLAESGAKAGRKPLKEVANRKVK